jgi:molybdate transport system permease protein
MAEISLEEGKADRVRKGRQRGDLLGRTWKLFTLPLLVFIALPVLALFLRLTPESFFTLQEQQVVQAVRLSLVTSLTTVLITLIFGTPVAYLLYRRRSLFTRLVDTLVDLPTVLPPAVAGVALLMAFGRQGLAGNVLSAFGISIPFTTAAVIMAQTFIAAPLYIKSAALGFSGVNCELKRAAALDGANKWQVFRYIMLPMSWTSIVSGSVLTWARALGEFGATIIFAGNYSGRTQTMPLAIYIGFEIDLNVALLLSAILILFSFLVLAVVKWIFHDRILIGPSEDQDW